MVHEKGTKHRFNYKWNLESNMPLDGAGETWKMTNQILVLILLKLKITFAPRSGSAGNQISFLSSGP